MSPLNLFLKKLALAALPPVLLLGAIYFCIDPFKVLRDYDDYFAQGRISPGVNKGMIVIDNFDRHIDSCHYDSFIFGSSVSKYYRTDEWKQYLPADASPVHLDSSSESLHSMLLKMKYVQSRGAHIRNALLVLTPDIFSHTDMQAPPFVDHWKIDPDRSRIRLHWLFVRSFFEREFQREYVTSQLVGEPVMFGVMPKFDTITRRLEPTRNEEFPVMADRALDAAPESYLRQTGDFALLNEKPEELCSYVTSHSYADAKAIADLLAREGTDYRVVIGPRMDGKYINTGDLRILRKAFGKMRVYDFSRELAGMRDSLGSFYDRTHYRSNVAVEIMRRTYRLSPQAF